MRTWNQPEGLGILPAAILVASCVLLPESVLASPGAARFDPESHKPYELQVVLHMANHRLLTPVFQNQVERQLRDSLQAALGDLAHVQVTRAHPLLRDTLNKGLEHAFEDWRSSDERKTHFVFIDFADAGYGVQARQYDGFTGLTSPVVRHARTADRELVAATAAFLIQQDFGLTGTVTKMEAKDRVELTLKGGGLGVALEPWLLKKDDVFAVAEVQEQTTGTVHSMRVPWLLLQATEEPRDGRVMCQVHHRFGSPLGNVRAAYRGMKLGTIRAPLRLRIVADEPLARPLSGRQVQIGSPASWPANLERKSTDADGLVQSDQSYQNLALVRISEGGRPIAQLPIEIIDERPVTVGVNVQPHGEELGKLYLERDRWSRRTAESLDTASAIVRKLNALADRPEERSLATAKSCLKTLEEDISRLAEERESLRRDAAVVLKDKPLDLADGERQLEELQNRRRKLDMYITSMEEIIKKEKDPAQIKLRELAEQARLLEGQADYEQAIALYRRVVDEGAQDPRISKRLHDLEEAWKPKNEKHEQARSFIYKTWPSSQTAAQMKSRLAKLRESFTACRAAGDQLTPQKLLLLNLGLVAKLEKEADSLHPQDNDDDRRTAEAILDLAKQLKSINEEVRAYLRQGKKE
jgi:hypothetical protein